MPEKDEILEKLRNSDPIKQYDAKNLKAKQKRTNTLAVAGVASVAVLSLTVGYVSYNSTQGKENVIAENPENNLSRTDIGVNPNTFNESNVDTGVKSENSVADMSMLPYNEGKFTYNTSNLPTEATTSEVWVFNGKETYNEDKLNALKPIFGVEGENVKDSSSLLVKSTNGKILTMAPDSMTSINYYDPSFDPYACVNTTLPIEPRADEMIEPDGGYVDVMPPQDCENNEIKGKLSDEESINNSKEILNALGYNSDELTYQVTSYDDVMQFVNVSLNNSSDSNLWTFNYAGEGLNSFYGPVAPLVSLGNYPVISAQEAGERLNDVKFGGSDNYYHIMSEETSVSVTPENQTLQEEMTPPDVLNPGDLLPWKVTNVNLIESELTTQVKYLNNITFIMPTYILTGENENQTWAVNAISSEALNFN